MDSGTRKRKPTPLRPARLKLAQRLVGLVEGFAGRRVVVLGDLVADEFVYADIARVSREAPVLILEHRRNVSVPGGGGNSAANLRALEARPVPVGVVGRDDAGRRLLEAFKARGIPRSSVISAARYRTPTKSRILAGGAHTRRQQIVRIDSGSPRRDHAKTTVAALRRELRRVLPRAEGLLVADYGYGVTTPAIVADLLPELQARGLTTTVDSRSRVALFRGVAACTPNQEELEQALGLEGLDDDRAVDNAGRRLLRRTGDQAVLITRGARGMRLYVRGKRPVDVPAYGSEEIADVTGAGDTVIATFTLALIAGASAVEAAHLANYAAGLVVRKAATATVERPELIDAIREDLG